MHTLDFAEPSVAIVAEKPSVARDIARVVGATKQAEGYLHGQGHIVTWAVGHLVRLAQPDEMRPEWKSWQARSLPMLPQEWPLVVYEQSRDQFQVVSRILNSPKVMRVVCATDAGREGELIFRYIYEAAGCTKQVSRLWVSSLTPEAIRKGLETIKPASAYDALADAARGRSRADWLVGMNLSRAYTLALGEDFSVGRVQTPTLAMIVERELAIRAFIPEDYTEVEATFSPGGDARYKGLWFRPGKQPLSAAMRLAADGAEAEELARRARTGQAHIESLTAEAQRMAPPLLYDLTELQRHANRLFGFSAQQTLDLAQALYEKHKLISYPRTDSRHLSADVASTLPRVVDAVRGPYQELLAPGTGRRPLGRRFVDDAKVTDHHAIIPTPTAADFSRLPPQQARIYDLVCRRLLSAWHDEHIWSVTTVITRIVNPGLADLYHSSGTTVQQAGWKVLEWAPDQRSKPGAETGDAGPQPLPAGLQPGQPQAVVEARVLRKKTRPPKRFSEATLLTAMETAGKTLDEKELSEAMKDCGLGTPATRASIIEVLLKRTYIERQGRMLAATGKGIRLIEVVHPEVKSPAMTGQWEAQLQRIHRGAARLPLFIKGIEEYVREVVGKALQTGNPRESGAIHGAAPPARAPVAGVPLDRLLHERFGFASFRPTQEAVCRAAVAGEDVLLVMPTGSGKSLCYQLPGFARGGTTLVVSPLIALMEDQAARLREMGFRAERIHSGRDRSASRQVCSDYLNGQLDFLFIAPERLQVAGFPVMLARRKPVLIAIDEAHCISQWGHDFRPDYRRIGQHLPLFRPAPVIALTATATPIVQDDIVVQLGLAGAKRFIQGFRRDNIAIEVVEVAVSCRAEIALGLLQNPARRPAIVYTPTRRECESLALLMRLQFPAAAYHAGLDAKRRDQVQTAFLEGRLEVIVATIAFGMGIDKPDVRTVIHTALPGSMEAYYQEIGRAGRDGGPSRAILMQSYADRRTHDYFFERDYPEADVLGKIFQCLSGESQPKKKLVGKSTLGSEVFDIALEKLWIHGGVVIDDAENIARGNPSWRDSYTAQRDQKLAQLEQMLRFAECNQCRMVSLVRHFGDLSDARIHCGICDFCAPGECVTQAFRSATPEETRAGWRAIELLRANNATSAGRLHALAVTGSALDRRAFERLLGGMARAGLVVLVDDSFEKEGRRIDFKRVQLTAQGRAIESPVTFSFSVTEPVAAPSLPRKKPKREKPRVKTGSAGTTIEALRAWRLAEARRRGVPAFRILSEKTLHAIADESPQTADALLAISGVGLRTVEKHGAAILRILKKGTHREASA